MTRVTRFCVRLLSLCVLSSIVFAADQSFVSYSAHYTETVNANGKITLLRSGDEFRGSDGSMFRTTFDASGKQIGASMLSPSGKYLSVNYPAKSVTSSCVAPLGHAHKKSEGLRIETVAGIQAYVVSIPVLNDNSPIPNPNVSLLMWVSEGSDEIPLKTQTTFPSPTGVTIYTRELKDVYIGNQGKPRPLTIPDDFTRENEEISQTCPPKQ